MIESLEAHAAEQLRGQNGQTMTLSSLHTRLVSELGSAAGSYHQLYQTLKQARTRFAVLERADTVYSGVWPEQVRHDYERAMEHAGFDLSPVVTLAPEAYDESASSVLEALRTTLFTFSAEFQGDTTVASEIIGVLNALQDLPRMRDATRPTTIPLRDLRR